MARVNPQPPMHQLVVLSIGWAAFFHLALDGVHDSPFIFATDHYTFFSFGLFFVVFFLDLTSHIPCSPSYPHKYYTNLGTLLIIPPY